ncbi:MAG: uridine diphosphate-N-acetylglucosamine-binding protein YvcK [Actinomycetota bacterium]
MVAIGGGHGLAMVLEAMVDRSDAITGVVSVADDGGSSGRLRRDLGILAPGDMRRCLAALTPHGLMRDALEHRFEHGVLSGHPAGNVLLASLMELEPDPVVVMDTLTEMVGARGRVLPATCEPVDLLATAERGTVKGQVAISESGAIDDIRFSPSDPTVPDAVVTAIVEADLIVLGPGSLYTSVLAPVVPGVAAALGRRQGVLAYIANLAPEVGETDGYGLDEHVDAVMRHGVEPDVVVADANAFSDGRFGDRLRRYELVGALESVHDPRRLGAVLSGLVS